VPVAPISNRARSAGAGASRSLDLAYCHRPSLCHQIAGGTFSISWGLGSGVLVGTPHVRCSLPRSQVPSNVIKRQEHIQLGWVVRWVLSTPPGHPAARRCVRVVQEAFKKNKQKKTTSRSVAFSQDCVFLAYFLEPIFLCVFELPMPQQPPPSMPLRHL
jgi:hypothetical protein